MPNAVIRAVSQDGLHDRLLGSILYDEGQMDGLRGQMRALGRGVSADDLFSHVTATSAGREVARIPLPARPRDSGEL